MRLARSSTRLEASLAALALLLAGCSDDSGNPRICEPGETQVCVCPGGLSGAQSCSDDGTRWNACECGGADADADADGDADAPTDAWPEIEADVAEDSGTDDGDEGDGGLEPCSVCLRSTCAEELAACEGACLHVQSCIDTICESLDPIEVGSCQLYCQDTNPGGRDPHLAVVNCAVASDCSPPCGFEPDEALCRERMRSWACADEWAACESSVDCAIYRDCLTTCVDFAECVACSGTTSGMSGRVLLETYEACVASGCILESWLSI